MNEAWMNVRLRMLSQKKMTLWKRSDFSFNLDELLLSIA